MIRLARMASEKERREVGSASPHPSPISKLWILQPRHGISKGRYDGQGHFSLEENLKLPKPRNDWASLT